MKKEVINALQDIAYVRIGDAGIVRKIKVGMRIITDSVDGIVTQLGAESAIVMKPCGGMKHEIPIWWESSETANKLNPMSTYVINAETGENFGEIGAAGRLASGNDSIIMVDSGDIIMVYGKGKNDNEISFVTIVGVSIKEKGVFLINKKNFSKDLKIDNLQILKKYYEVTKDQKVGKLEYFHVK